jgi:hypothetical protein
MIRNYLRVAFRNLWRHKGFSLLNIIGLTVGMSAFFLVFLYVSFELSYDSSYSKADRIYRIVADGGGGGAGHCARDGQLSGSQGGAGQPGKKFKNRVMQHFSHPSVL